MSKNLPLLIGALLAIWLIGSSWWYHNNHCHSAPTSQSSLTIKDGNFSSSASNNISFGWSSANPEIPAEAGNTLKSLAEYLKNSPNRYLTLSGLFASDEVENSEFNSLGQARAEAIKNELIKYGADETNIGIDDFRVDNNIFKSEKLDGGVYFTFSETVEKEVDYFDSEIETTETSDYFDSKTIYYKSGDFELDLNEVEIAHYLRALKDYLRSNPDRTVLISGHTDNIGDQKSNELISRARAAKVRRFLVDNRVPRAQILTNFEASNNPVSDNETEEGKAKNRRVEITVQ